MFDESSHRHRGEEELSGVGLIRSLVCMISQSMTGSERGRWPLCHCHGICSQPPLRSPLSALSLSLCSTFCVVCSYRHDGLPWLAPHSAPGSVVSNDGVWRVSPVSHRQWPLEGPAHTDPDIESEGTGARDTSDTSESCEGVTQCTDPLMSRSPGKLVVSQSGVTPLQMLSCSPQLSARNSPPTITF